MKFCIEHGVFYDDGHTEIPAAAITVTDKEFQDLTTGRNTGKKIIVLGQDGKLFLKDADPIVLTTDEINSRRLRAYANPITGSDRYFAEAQRMQMMGEAGWEDVRAEGVKLFVAIQDKFPWPAQQTSRPDTPAPDMGRF